MTEAVANSEAFLPERFRDLDSFAAWCLPLERERQQKRLRSDMDEIRALYDTMLPRMADIIGYLNELPIDNLPEDAERLLHLCFSFVEVSSATVIFGQPAVIDGFDAERFVPVE